LLGAILVKLHGMRLFVHGIRVVGNIENTAIAGSEKISFPDAPPVRRAPASYPHLAGRYAKLGSILVRNCNTGLGMRLNVSISPHDLRRHSATYASRNGVSFEIISTVLLRHQDLPLQSTWGRSARLKGHWVDGHSAW
jgi:hypothetical protein